MVVAILLEAHILIESDIFEVFRDISFACEEESSPFLEIPSSQIHTWFFIEMRCADHLAREIPCPLMQWAGDGFRISPSSIHDCLTMTTYIGYELYSCTRPREHTTIMFMFQSIKITNIWDYSCMSDISWPTSKEDFELFLEYFCIEVCSRWKHIINKKWLIRRGLYLRSEKCKKNVLPAI